MIDYQKQPGEVHYQLNLGLRPWQPRHWHTSPCLLAVVAPGHHNCHERNATHEEWSVRSIC